MNDAETNRDRGIVMHDRDCARSVSHPPPPPQISVSVSFPSSRQGNNAFARKHTLSYGPGPGSGNTRYKYGSIALSDAAGKTKSKPTSSSTSRSPDRFRDNIHTPNQLNVVPEDQILMQFTESPEIEHSQLQQTFPRSHRMGSSSSLDEAEDEEEMIEELERELDEELGVEGLFRGSYSRLILLYLLSPLTFLIAFGVLAALPYLLWSLNPSSPNPGHTYIYHPFPELLLSSSLFSLAYLIRKPLREGAENVVRWTEENCLKLLEKNSRLRVAMADGSSSDLYAAPSAYLELFFLIICLVTPGALCLMVRPLLLHHPTSEA
ncbi:hypothetical protein H0H93_016966 [Arthromyces matolae]|nr:hypothetical protein H0H93_016966 [Arthromyces matolae]